MNAKRLPLHHQYAIMEYMENSTDKPTPTPKDDKHKQPPAQDSRAQKMRKIAQQVKDGTYKVDSDAVADRVLRQHFLPDKDTDQH